MSVFRNIRIYPSHGTRSAVVTWETDGDVPAGDVFVAFSVTGTQGTWQVLNAEAAVPSAVGMYSDDRLQMDAGWEDGFYRLLLTENGNDHFSEAVQIMGDVTAREYGMIRAIIHREYTMMRVTNGIPVWHCIPREHGDPADNIDEDTGAANGPECGDGESYGQAFKGGFYPPVLTWMKIIQFNEGLQDDPEEFLVNEINRMAVRLMAFPRPSRDHMLVDPATDRRYLVDDEIKPYRFRGVVPVAHEATVSFLHQSDSRYRFQMPEVDLREYRGMSYWNPSMMWTPLA